ncbi:MAG: ArsR family transcriptional regulator [Candidatus Bathyarchaeota archaeon]|nr:MAG: ArsR family transcriptional regulator [Candidatus Bathyarchaeota archaeon]
MSVVEENQGISPQEVLKVTKDLPKSARTVFLALVETGPMKSKDLSEHTALSSRTVRYGLEILRERKLVRRIPDFNDLRSHFYKAQPTMS